MKKDRKIFVHAQSDTFELVNGQATVDGLMGEKAKPDADYYYFPGRRSKYKIRKEPSLTKEIHIYLPSQYVGEEKIDGKIKIPYSEIDQIHVVKDDRVISSLMFVGASIVFFGLLIALVFSQSSIF